MSSRGSRLEWSVQGDDVAPAVCRLGLSLIPSNKPIRTEDNMSREERIFSISGNNKGLWCPFKPISCQEGYCHQCQIYLDWQKLAEVVVVCAWCGKVMQRNPGLGESVLSHGICLECQRNHFPEDLRVKAEDRMG